MRRALLHCRLRGTKGHQVMSRGSLSKSPFDGPLVVGISPDGGWLRPSQHFPSASVFW